MIHHILSLILGCFIVSGIFIGVFWLFMALEDVEEKVKDTKAYKVGSVVSTILLWVICITFSLLLCWSLGDSILTAIGG